MFPKRSLAVTMIELPVATAEIVRTSPVAYQSFAQDVLPPALQDSNPWKVEQTIN
jgi:hypothetical protein